MYSNQKMMIILVAKKVYLVYVVYYYYIRCKKYIHFCFVLLVSFSSFSSFSPFLVLHLLIFIFSVYNHHARAIVNIICCCLCYNFLAAYRQTYFLSLYLFIEIMDFESDRLTQHNFDLV